MESFGVDQQQAHRASASKAPTTRKRDPPTLAATGGSILGNDQKFILYEEPHLSTFPGN
jgi:hypothetical protein